MLDFDLDLTALGITDTGKRAAAETELQRLVTEYQFILHWIGRDGKTLTRGLSKSIKQNLEHLEAAREKVTPILAAPELDESIFPIPYLHATEAVSTAVTALDKAIRLYTEAVEQIGPGQIEVQTPTYHLTIGLLALIHKNTGVRSTRFSTVSHTRWLIRVVHKITGEEVTLAWVAKRITEFRQANPTRQ